MDILKLGTLDNLPTKKSSIKISNTMTPVAVRGAFMYSHKPRKHGSCENLISFWFLRNLWVMRNITEVPHFDMRESRYYYIDS